MIHAASVGASSAPARPGGRFGIGLVAGQVCATGAAFWLARSTTEASLPVVLPLTVAAIAAGVFYLALRQWRRSASPFFEVGGVYVAVVTLYAVYPLVGFLVLGLGYSSSNDDRLAVGRPGPEEVGLIGWYYVLHLVVFGGAYLLARGRGAGPAPPAVRRGPDADRGGGRLRGAHRLLRVPRPVLRPVGPHLCRVVSGLVAPAAAARPADEPPGGRPLRRGAGHPGGPVRELPPVALGDRGLARRRDRRRRSRGSAAGRRWCCCGWRRRSCTT